MTCSPQSIGPNGNKEENRRICAILSPLLIAPMSLIIGLILFNLYPCPAILLWLLIAYVMCVTACFYGKSEFTPRHIGKKELRIRGRLSRFFSSFSHIETLSMDNFNSRLHILDAAQMILNGVAINRLEIREHNLTDSYQCVFQRFRDLFSNNYHFQKPHHRFLSHSQHSSCAHKNQKH